MRRKARGAAMARQHMMQAVATAYSGPGPPRSVQGPGRSAAIHSATVSRGAAAR